MKKTDIPLKVRLEVCKRAEIDGEPRCEICGSGEMLEVHHIYYRSQGGKGTEQNLICLCKSCHNTVHSDKKTFQPYLIERLEKYYGKIDVENLMVQKYEN